MWKVLGLGDRIGAILTCAKLQRGNIVPITCVCTVANNMEVNRVASMGYARAMGAWQNALDHHVPMQCARNAARKVAKSIVRCIAKNPVADVTVQNGTTSALPRCAKAAAKYSHALFTGLDCRRNASGALVFLLGSARISVVVNAAYRWAFILAKDIRKSKLISNSIG